MIEDFPLITIGIPTYNRAAGTLPKTLESALGQDYPNFEIVVSDNGSTDNTQEVVREFGTDRINYIRQPVNIGVTKNYNACLQAARGDYFLLLHDDDLIDTDFLTTCMRHGGNQTSYGLIRTGTRMVDGAGGVVKEPRNEVATNAPEDLYEAWLTGKAAFYFCSTLFNTHALREIGGFGSKNNLFEDGIAIIEIAHRWPILNIKEAKASFRLHGEQRTHFAAVAHWCEDFKQAIDLIHQYAGRDRDVLYLKGMRRFSKVGLHFAERVRHPAGKIISTFKVSKFFHYRYWPANRKRNLIGWVGSLFYPERKPSF
jgi:glycosyltransferase involved in cell wall biosynthesis